MKSGAVDRARLHRLPWELQYTVESDASSTQYTIAGPEDQVEQRVQELFEEWPTRLYSTSVWYMRREGKRQITVVHRSKTAV